MDLLGSQEAFFRNLRKGVGCLVLGIILTPSLRSVAYSAAESLDLTQPMKESGKSGHLSAIEMELWNSAGFQKQFAESYIAETDVEPRVTVEERDQMQKILGLISSDKMEEAARVLEKSRDEASSAVFDFTLANIYFQQEKLDEAAKVYQTAVEKYPKFRRAWRNLGLIYVRQIEFEKALPALTKVVELGGGDAVTYGLMGFAYSSVDNHLPAESAYRMALLLDPHTMDWKMGLARSLFEQERYGEAVALCGSMIAEFPDRADLWLLQANAYIGLNQPLRAAENYELVDRLGQSTIESLIMLGDIYINEGLYEMAVPSYIRGIKKDDKINPERVIRAAKVLTARGALRESQELVANIETLMGSRLDDNSREDLLKLRARLAMAEGADEEGAKVLEEIVALDPLDGEALILLGQHSSRNSDPEKAIFYYERAAGIEKFEADVKLRHAQLLVGQGKYDQALPLLRKAQTISPRDDVQKYLEQVERMAKSR